MLRRFHHLAIFFFRELRFDFRFKPDRREDFFLTLFDQLCHFFQFFTGLFIGLFQIICHHTCDEKNLLAVVVECDHIIKQHQIQIPEILLFLIF